MKFSFRTRKRVNVKFLAQMLGSLVVLAVRRHLVHVAMTLRRYTDAREHLEALLQLSAGDAELEHLLGECAEANGQYAQAAGWFAKAVEHAPDRIESYVRQARLLGRRLG